jgi:hypothetical protein
MGGLGAAVDEPVAFDGTNDFLTLGSALSGVASSKQCSASYWFRRTGGNGVAQAFLATVPSLQTRLDIDVDNKPKCVFRNSAATTICRLDSATAITDTNWHHLMFSFDLANAANRHLYLDGVSALVVVLYTDDTINFAGSTNWMIGAGTAAGADKLNANLGNLWFSPGTYIDLSQATNRNKFLNVDIPADLGTTGQLPTGTTPRIYLAGTTATWHTNKGTGGGFTLTGALTSGQTPVQFIGGAAPPAIEDNVSTNFAEGTAAPQVFTTAALEWFAGWVLKSVYATTGTSTMSGVAGDTDDTFALEAAALVPDGARFWLHGGTVVGGTLDANVNYTRGTAQRRGSAGLFTISGSSGNDTHASNFATSTGAGPALPQCAAFTTTANNCLVFACMDARGSHITSPPTAPAGYSLLFSQAGATDAPTSTNSAPTLAVAFKVQATAGAVAAATFGGLASIGVVPWATIHFAVKP